MKPQHLVFFVLFLFPFFAETSAQCGTNRLVNPGFDTPLQPNFGDNLTSQYIFPEPDGPWRITPEPFNIVRVNGSVYNGGPDNAKNGQQYADVAYSYPLTGTIYQDFTLGATSSITYGGYFSSRTGGNWTAYIEIISLASGTVVNTSTTASIGPGNIESWAFVHGTDTLAAGDYRFEAFVDDDGNFDAAFLYACDAPCIWDGSIGNWSDDPKWSCGQVPGAMDDVLILDGTVTLDQPSASIASMTMHVGNLVGSNPLSVSGGLSWDGGTIGGSGTMTVGGAVAASNVVSLSGKTLVCDGAFTNNGTFSQVSGMLQTNGSFANNGIFSIAAGGVLDANGGFVNSGTGILNGNGTVDLSGASSFPNAGTVAPGLSTPGTVTMPGTLNMTAFDNSAGGTLAIELGTTGSDLLAVNSATILDGTLEVSFLPGYVPVIGHDFTIMTCAGGCSGTFDYLINPGNSPGVWQIDLSVANEVHLKLIAAPLGCTWIGGATGNWNNPFNWSCGHVPQTPDHVSITGAAVALDVQNIAIASLTLVGSSLLGNESLSILGDFIWNSSGIGGSGMATVGGATTASGLDSLGVGRTLVCNGAFTNNDTVVVNSILFANGSFTNAASGTIGGNGMIDLTGAAPINNLGTIAPGCSPGILTMTTFPNANATLAIELAGNDGPGQPNGHDKLVILGDAALGGTLDITLLSGFLPEIGNSFDILNSNGTVSGNFSTIVHSGTNPDAWDIDLTDPNQIGLVLVDYLSKCTWDGSTGNWSDAAKWSCGHVPIPEESAVINAGTVTLDLPNANIANMTLSGGTLSGSGNLLLSGALTWSGGTMSGAGNTRAALATNITNAPTLDARTLTLNGGGTITGGFNTSNGANLIVPAGQTLTCTANSDVVWGGNGGTVTLLGGTGTLVKNGAGILDCDFQSFQNAGAIVVEEGRLRLGFGGTHNLASFNILYDERYCSVKGGTHTFTGCHFSGAGAFETIQSGNVSSFTGNTIGASIQLRLTGTGSTFNLGQDLSVTSLVHAGTQTTSGSGNLTVSGFTQFLGGTFNVTGNLTLFGLTVSGGTLSPTGNLTLNYMLNWSGGTIGGAGTMTVAEAATITNAPTLDTRSLTLNGGGTITGGFNTSNGANLIVPAGQTLTCTANSDVVWGGNGGTVTLLGGTGTLVKNGTGNIECDFQNFQNTGTIIVDAGILRMGMGGTHDGATFLIANTFLTVKAGTHTFTGCNFAGTSFGPGGFATILAGNVGTFSGNTVTNMRFNLVGETSTFHLGQDLFLNSFLLSGGQVVNGTGNITVGFFGTTTLVGGMLDFNGTLTVNGSLNWLGGTTESGVHTIVAGSGGVTNNAVVANGPVTNISTFTVQSGTFTANGSFVNGYYGATLTLQSGSTFDANGTFENDFTATINGNGTLDLTNATSISIYGNVSPGLSPGILTINTYDNSNATLQIELAGTGGAGVANGHDQLVVNGNVSFDGAVEVNFLNGFAPASGTFLILTYTGTASGALPGIFCGTGCYGSNFTLVHDVSAKTLSLCIFLAEATADIAICSGQSATLTAGSTGSTTPFTYLWNTGETTASISVSPSNTTTYSVCVTDANGCTDDAETLVSVSVAATNIWTNGGDGLNWSDYANWSEWVVPSLCHDVVIPAGNVVMVPAGYEAVGKTLDVAFGAQLLVEPTGILMIEN